MATPNTKRNGDADPNDLYQTEPLATQAALDVGVFAGLNRVYDPCDGLGGITDILEQNGLETVRSDVTQYDRPIGVFDFLELSSVSFFNIDAIVFNPPFKLTEAFVDKALSLHPKLIMFNRINFLETPKRARKLASGEWNLTDFYIFSYRVGCSKGKTSEKPVKAVMYAWFVFDQNAPIEAPRTHWII